MHKNSFKASSRFEKDQVKQFFLILINPDHTSISEIGFLAVFIKGTEEKSWRNKELKEK